MNMIFLSWVVVIGAISYLASNLVNVRVFEKTHKSEAQISIKNIRKSINYLSVSFALMVTTGVFVIFNIPDLTKTSLYIVFISITISSIYSILSKINNKSKLFIYIKACVILLVPLAIYVYSSINSSNMISNIEGIEKYSQEINNSSSEKSSDSKNYTLEDIVYVYFLSTEDLICPTLKDNKNELGYYECIEKAQEILSIREGRAIFFLRVIYLYFILSSIFTLLVFLYQGKSREKSSKDGVAEDIVGDVVHRAGMMIAKIFAGFFALYFSGVDFSSLGLFGGLAAAGLTMSLRDLLGNLGAGLLLLWDRSLKKGDVITIPKSENDDTGGTYGIVDQIGIRHTVVEDRNTVRRLIPNSILIGNQIENWTHDRNLVRLSCNISVAYGSDLRVVKRVLESVCYEVDRVSIDRPPQALITAYLDSGIEIALRFWLRDPDKGIRPVISEIYVHVAERFRDEGIVIPYPARDIRFPDLIKEK